jgi:hypothetical protein
MKRQILCLLVGSFFGLLFVTDTFACSCSILDKIGKSDKELVEEARKSADAVFVGEIVELRFSEPSDELGSLVRYAKFRIERSWKGPEEEFIEVETFNICCVCGVGFEKGQRYLIYAYSKGENGLATNICTRTFIYQEDNIDEKYLGDPRKYEKS